MNGRGTAVCNRFQQDGVVCPLNLNSGLFTVGALDNIDYNPSSTTAQGSFHGTGISLFQFPSSSVDGAQSRPPSPRTHLRELIPIIFSWHDLQFRI